jgi:hypothetical protein
MPAPDEVILGPLTRLVVGNAKWRESSQYPAFQVWADEAERLFAFLEAQSMFERFLPRLCAREREKTAAMAEARTGFFFHRNGFRILRWEPEEVKDHPGDLDIQWRNCEPIFVEVKAPDWEGELTERERHEGRKDLPKYINAEGRAIAPQGLSFTPLERQYRSWQSTGQISSLSLMICLYHPSRCRRNISART